MIQVELKKYFNTRLFWVLNAVGLVILVIYSLFLAGMDRVGLMPITAFDYLIATSNLYVTNLMPLLVCLFMAYAFASEYQWRTMMIPLLEGRSRLSILWGKVVLCVLTTLTFILAYLGVAVGIAFGLFTSQDMLLESRLISPAEAILRVAAGSFWVALITVEFGLLAMVLVARFRHPVLGTIGSFLAFMVFLMTADARHNPLVPLIQVPRLLVQSANLSSATLASPLLLGIGLWLVTTGAVLGLFIAVFIRQDIAFE